MSYRELTNPFDPTGWNTFIDVDDPIRVTTVPGTSFLMLDRDSNRLWFEVISEVDPADMLIWPQKQTAEYGIGPIAGQQSILIHNASRPGAVQGQWWCWVNIAIGSLQILVGRLAR